MESNANIALLPVDGDLDVTTVAPLRASIDRLIDGGCQRVVLNMAAVGFVDSAGMGLIFREIRKMRSSGGLLSLVNVTPPVMRALALARVVDYAPVSANVGEVDVPELDPGAQPLWRYVIRIDPADMGDARAKVESLLERLDFSDDERFDAKLAVGEALGNAVDHTDGTCVLTTVAGYPDRVVVEVSDCGCGMPAPAEGLRDGRDPLGAQGRSDAQDLSDGPWSERGRGIKLMRLLADSVTISPKSSGSGTVVRIVKLTHRDNTAAMEPSF
ncbi:MAG: anti-sigma factor antagonist [Olegusella sp.]|nr:anti-sigma factor antagonist [Olegusella sp.]